MLLFQTGIHPYEKMCVVFNGRLVNIRTFGRLIGDETLIDIHGQNESTRIDWNP